MATFVTLSPLSHLRHCTLLQPSPWKEDIIKYSCVVFNIVSTLELNQHFKANKNKKVSTFWIDLPQHILNYKTNVNWLKSIVSKRIAPGNAHYEIIIVGYQSASK